MDGILDLFSRTGDSVWAVDAECRIVHWNASAEHLLGYTAEEAIGQTCYELLGGLDPEGNPFCRAECPILEYSRLGNAVEAFDMQVPGHSGKLTLLNVSIVAVPDPDASVADAVLVHLARRSGNGRITSPPLRIHLLGDVMVQRADGSSVGGSTWRQTEVRSLLAHLALGRGKPIHRDDLVEALWPSSAYPAALRYLGAAIHDLRSSLEPTLKSGDQSRYIHFEGDHYYLNGSQLHWLDVDAFENGLQSARQEPELNQAVSTYRRALSLYRGDLLANHEPCSPEQKAEQKRLRELYMAGLSELTDLLARQHTPAT